RHVAGSGPRRQEPRAGPAARRGPADATRRGDVVKCPTPCPERQQLQGLLSNHLPERQQEEIVHHLDDCEGCQKELEALARGDSSWPDDLRGLEKDRPAATSAFWSGLKNVENALKSGVALAATQAEVPAARRGAAEDGEE